MDTLNAILTRRSVRAFKKEPLPPAMMDTLLQSAATAPSGGNLQAWSFIALQDPRRLQALAMLSPGMGTPPPAAVVLCIDRSRAGKPGDGTVESMLWMDLGAAMQNLLLAAHALGLGACPIGSFHAAAVAVLLALPEHLQPALIVTVGFPGQIPERPKKRPAAEIIFLESYRNENGN